MTANECTCRAADMPFGRCCKAKTPTERRALHPAAVVEAWDWLDIYARHWATTGRDWQTLDNLGGADRVTAEAHLETLREAGLIEPQSDFKGNFVKKSL